MSGRAIAGEHSASAGPASHDTASRERLWPYALVGLYLGFVFTRAEVISWFRIQEMFRFQSFHMYGIIGSAVVVAALGVAWLKRSRTTSLTDRPFEWPSAERGVPGRQYWLGGAAFGVGWGLTGACPGPLYVLIGNGVTVMVVALLSAVGGAWAYGRVRHLLPHD